MIGFVTELSTVNICEEVFAWGYTTSGNYWWIGTMSGYHEIKLEVIQNDKGRSDTMADK